MALSVAWLLVEANLGLGLDYVLGIEKHQVLPPFLHVLFRNHI